LQRKRIVLSKCYARIVSFAIPVAYLSEQAVIVGRGSFASYHDFRAFLDIAGKENADGSFPIDTALRFTTARDARRASDIVQSSVNQLLKNEQENVSLKRRMDVLQEVMGRWDSTTVQDPVTVYDQLMTGLLNLLDVQHVVLFFRDQQQGGYIALYGCNRGTRERERSVLDEHDAIVRLLLAQKPYVVSSAPVLGLRRNHLQSGEADWYFPLWMRGNLEGIVQLANGALKESDIRIVRAFCTKAALTVENLRLHADLYRKFERFSATVELAKTLTPIRSYDVLLQSILSKSADLLKAERGSLMLLDRETNALLLEVQKGVVEGLAEKMRIPKGQGIAGKVAERGEPLLVENVESDPRIRQKNRDHYKTRSFLSIPLKIGDRTIGVLNLSDKVSGEVFNEDDLQMIQSFASQAVVVLERNVLYTQTERLKKLSITDPLTGLLNRRYFQERLEEEIARSERHGRMLSLMMLDIDGFKTYNDTFGHPAGDKLLKLISDAIMNSVRTMDIVARFGGDEFLILLPETDPVLAAHIAERIRKEVTDAAFKPGGTPPGGAAAVSVSIGIASYPQSGDTLEKVVEQVDRALYQAKMKGKNRIVTLS
jgi:diguanylate cyclase (GGDEF)-like protein